MVWSMWYSVVLQVMHGGLVDASFCFLSLVSDREATSPERRLSFVCVWKHQVYKCRGSGSHSIPFLISPSSATNRIPPHLTTFLLFFTSNNYRRTGFSLSSQQNKHVSPHWSCRPFHGRRRQGPRSRRQGYRRWRRVLWRYPSRCPR